MRTENLTKKEKHKPRNVAQRNVYTNVMSFSLSCFQSFQFHVFGSKKMKTSKFYSHFPIKTHEIMHLNFAIILNTLVLTLIVNVHVNAHHPLHNLNNSKLSVLKKLIDNKNSPKYRGKISPVKWQLIEKAYKRRKQIVDHQQQLLKNTYNAVKNTIKKSGQGMEINDNKMNHNYHNLAHKIHPNLATHLNIIGRRAPPITTNTYHSPVLRSAIHSPMPPRHQNFVSRLSPIQNIAIDVPHFETKTNKEESSDSNRIISKPDPIPVPVAATVDPISHDDIDSTINREVLLNNDKDNSDTESDQKFLKNDNTKETWGFKPEKNVESEPKSVTAIFVF